MAEAVQKQTAIDREEAARVKRMEVDVVVAEEEPLEPHVYEHPLLDGDHADYQHASETAGLDYGGELVDEVVEPRGKKAAAKDVADGK